MNLSSSIEVLLSKINEFSRISSIDSNETIKYALRQLLSYWSDVLAVADQASDDELFFLNTSRAVLSEVFILTLAKDCFDSDHLFTHEILRICFNLLIDYINVFIDQNTTFLISNICLIMSISSTLTSSILYTDMNLFNENENHLFEVMRQYIDKDFTHDNLTDGIISFVWNLSDNTLLVPLFLKTGYAKSLIDWIHVCQKKFREDKQIALLSILINMLRHDDGIDQFKTFDTINAIENIPMDSTKILERSMIEILLSDVYHMKLESMEIVDELLRIIIAAAEDAKNCYEGTHISEALAVLTKLFFNDKILLDTLGKTDINLPSTTKHGIIEFFASLLIKFYPNLSFTNNPSDNFTCVLLLNVLELISCHKEYRQIISTNKFLMKIIGSAANNEKNFNDSFMPRTMKRIQEAAVEIQKNLTKKN
ncbi:hypothetical protein I4U23_024607 [Adineta vaga]|nr:hypothetical protein I4U23_024607 [Adineta vaga]